MLNQLICAQSTQVATPQHGVCTSLPPACTGGAQHQSHQQQQSAACPGVTQHLQQLTANMNMNITCSLLAGRLPIFIENWSKLTQDPWVLQVVEGYLIEFLETPHQGRAPQEVQVSSDMQSQISEEIVVLLSQRAIEETQPGPQSFIYQIFLVEKKMGVSILL